MSNVNRRGGRVVAVECGRTQAWLVASPRRAGPRGAGGAARAGPQSAPGARARCHGALHRERAPLPVPVEHHGHRVPRPGAQGRRLGRGHEGDRPLVSEGGEVEVEEAARQLPRRAQAPQRDAGQGAGRHARAQEDLPLEVHGAHAVPAAAHERAQEGRQPAAAARAQRLAAQRRRALVRRVRVGAGVRAQAQSQRPPLRHRPQARLLVQGAEQAAVHGGALPGAQARARAAGRRARPARHLLQQHVPVGQALPLPHADPDQEDAVQRRDRGGAGSAGRAAELRQPVGARALVQQQRGGRRGRRQGLLSRAAARALPLLRPGARARRARRQQRGGRVTRARGNHCFQKTAVV